MRKLILIALCLAVAVTVPAATALDSEEGRANLKFRYERLDWDKDTWQDEHWAFEGRVAVGPNDKVDPPVASVSSPKPVYTAEARQLRVNGTVQIELWIDDKGQVVDATITKTLESGIDRNVFECVRRWKFSPASLNGAPVPSVLLIEFTFQVR